MLSLVIPFSPNPLLNDAPGPICNATSHEKHAQIVNPKLPRLYSILPFTHPCQNIVSFVSMQHTETKDCSLVYDLLY